MSILVVGSVALDTVVTPFASVDGVLGGAASYFSMAASMYDAVNMVAVVGDDFPQAYREELGRHRTDLAGLHTSPGRTFRWGGKYLLDMNSRETLFTELGVFADFTPEVPQKYRGSEVVFLANIQPSLQLDVLRQTQSGQQTAAAGAKPDTATGRRGVQLKALDTMNLWISTARADLTEVIRQVDVVLIAEEEARQYAETPSLRAAARYILGLGPQRLVVKQGSYGALLFGADGSFCAAPAYPLDDLRDPTGAGDAFAGGFLGYLSGRLATTGMLTSQDYHRALIHGNILGSFACEDFSVNRLRTLTQEEIAARYDEFVRFTHFEGNWKQPGA